MFVERQEKPAHATYSRGGAQKGENAHVPARVQTGAARTKPPAEDFPLFLDRDTGLDHDPDADLEVPLAIRKRRITLEKMGK